MIEFCGSSFVGVLVRFFEGASEFVLLVVDGVNTLGRLGLSCWLGWESQSREKSKEKMKKREEKTKSQDERREEKRSEDASKDERREE